CVLLSFFGREAKAQQSVPEVTLSLTDTAIDVIVQEIERQTGYHFFYNPAQFDSLRLSVSVNRQPLERALDQAFDNTDFHFSILPDKRYVFVTKGTFIKPDLPDGFFAKAKVNKDTVADSRQAGVPDYGDKKKVRADASIENKLFEIGPKNSPGGPGNVTV